MRRIAETRLVFRDGAAKVRVRVPFPPLRQGALPPAGALTRHQFRFDRRRRPARAALHTGKSGSDIEVGFGIGRARSFSTNAKTAHAAAIIAVAMKSALGAIA